MENYTIYCTTEQTKKALDLGAPIQFKTLCHYDLRDGKFIPYPDLDIDINGDPILIPPTVEQMIGWLEEQNILIEYTRFMGKYACRLLELHDNGEKNLHIQKIGSSRKEATLAAIDAALDYLLNSSTKAE